MQLSLLQKKHTFPMVSLQKTHTHTHRCPQTISPSHSSPRSFPLAPSGCEPDIPADRLSLKWLVGAAPITEAGTGERRSVWLRRTALAQGLISRASTLPALFTHRRRYTLPLKYKHSSLCPNSAAGTQTRFGDSERHDCFEAHWLVDT